MPRGMFGTTIGAMVAAAALLVGTGCGAKEAEVVSGALSKPVDRATVSMSLSADVVGQRMGVSLQGPYSSNGKDRLPSVDWRVQAQGMGAAPLEARVISSATNAFVQYGGQTYEVGPDKVAQFTQKAESEQGRPVDLAAFMEQAKSWFPESDTQQDAELDGEKVTRVTGRVDLSKALQGIMDLAKQSTAADPNAAKALQATPDVQQVEKYLSDPRFTLDVAKSDGTLRRIAVTAQLKGVPGGGQISFSVQLSDVGKPVTIQTPSSGRPIEELGKALGQVLGGAALTS
jgi:hypothetical protein